MARAVMQHPPAGYTVAPVRESDPTKGTTITWYYPLRVHLDPAGRTATAFEPLYFRYDRFGHMIFASPPPSAATALSAGVSTDELAQVWVLRNRRRDRAVQACERHRKQFGGGGGGGGTSSFSG